MAPSRFIGLEAARARFGPRADVLAAMMAKGDPLADAVVTEWAGHGAARREALLRRGLDEGGDTIREESPALAALLAHARGEPPWLDRERAARGGRLFLRAGVFGEMVLGLRSLVFAFASPAGNKPLYLSGRLRDSARRRLIETKRFVELVSTPDGMQPFADGFKATIRVRLLHASVRFLLARSPRWDAAAWGAPINQADMATSVLLFSLIVFEGLRILGIPVRPDEAEDAMHLWRFVGRVIGVDDALLCVSAADGRALWDLFSATQGPPDSDARALATALLEVPLLAATTGAERRRAESSVAVSYAASRALVGEAIADALGYPKPRFAPALPLARPFVRAAHAAAQVAPAAARAVQAHLARSWGDDGALAREGVHAVFPLPPLSRDGHDGRGSQSS